MRKVPFEIGQYYHVYNRGTDKRAIFCDEDDISRFFSSMKEFNTLEPIGGIYARSFKEKLGIEGDQRPLILFVAYCLNPNHFHFLVQPLVEKGVEKFMQRLGNGYTKFFNNKYERSGVLFQGKFKAKHVDSNEYLLHLSAYINGNNQLRHPMSKIELSQSSIYEYLKFSTFCSPEIILEQFPSREAYQIFFEASIEDIARRKEIEKKIRCN